MLLDRLQFCWFVFGRTARPAPRCFEDTKSGAPPPPFCKEAHCLPGFGRGISRQIGLRIALICKYATGKELGALHPCWSRRKAARAGTSLLSLVWRKRGKLSAKGVGGIESQRGPLSDQRQSASGAILHLGHFRGLIPIFRCKTSSMNALTCSRQRTRKINLA